MVSPIVDASDDDGDRRSANPIEKRRSAAARLVQVAGQDVVLSRSRLVGLARVGKRAQGGIGSRISEIGGDGQVDGAGQRECCLAGSIWSAELTPVSISRAGRKSWIDAGNGN